MTATMAISKFPRLDQNAHARMEIPSAAQHKKAAAQGRVDATTVSMTRPAGFTHAPVDKKTLNPMLARSWQSGSRVVQVDVFVFIKSRWYSRKKTLHVQNDSSEITFSFTCSKGTFRVGPGGNWKHKYKNSATAIQAMDRLVVKEVWQRGRQLVGDEMTVVVHRTDVS